MLIEIERDLNLEGTTKFAIFADPSGKWRVAAVPADGDSFDLRIPLKADWRGLRDKELS